MRRPFTAAGVAVCTGTIVVASILAPVVTPSMGGVAGAQEPPESSASSGPARTDGAGLTYTYQRESVAAPDSAGTRTHHGDGSADGPGAAPGAVPGPGARASTSEPVPAASTFAAPANEDFAFDTSGLSPAQTAVFEAAGGIWSSTLEVEVPIDVRVTTASFEDPSILGGAEPTGLHANGWGFPEPDVWYVSALAKQFAGRDLDPTSPDIDIVISSDFDFYEGIDASVPPDQTSLLNLALHELGHGLGHITLARPVGDSWSITWPTGDGKPLPQAYDLNLENLAGTPLVDLSGSALGAALTSRVLWNGPEAVEADRGLLPEIYAPTTFRPGSSTSHLDEGWYPDELMTPSIADGEAFLEVTPIARAMMADIGWGLEVTGREASLVTALSRDFVFAFPEPTELRRLVDALRAGATRRSVVVRFAESDEYLARLVDGYYLATLGRAGDPVGKAHWLAQLRSGRTPARVAAGFYASTEYYQRAGGTDRAWLTDLYVKILGRQPDPGGLATWVRKAAGGTARIDIAHAFYQSRESRSKRVTDLYAQLLGRSPDPGGLDHWSSALLDGRDVRLAIELARSPEYENRAFLRYG
jgi:hypothetical protein